jgi:integrase
MAERKKEKRRSYGTGTVVERSNGLTIGWREAVVQPDGTIKRVMRWKALGAVPRRQANVLLQTLMASGQTPKVESKSFRDVAERWQTIVLPVRKYSTRKHHTDILERKLLPIFGDMKIDEISNQDVQQFILEQQRRNYAPHTLDHYHNVLSTVLSTAVKWGYIKSNPARGVELPKIAPIRPQWVLTSSQAQQLLDRLSGCPKYAVALALLTGMRRGELFALRWSDFDEASSTLTVNQAVYDDVFDTPKTEKSLRVVPLSKSALTFLLDWRTRSKRVAPDNFVLTGRRGAMASQARILRDHIKPACEALGLPKASWLTFRRTFSSWGEAKGVGAKTRAELMGHSPEMNQSVYTKVIPDTLRSAVEIVGSELLANCLHQAKFVN